MTDKKKFNRLCNRFKKLSFELREYDMYAISLVKWMIRLGWGGENAKEHEIFLEKNRLKLTGTHS